MKKIRVLHLPTNNGNHPWALSRAERKLGLKSDLLLVKNHKFYRNFFPGDKEKSRAKVLEYTKKRTASQDIGEKCAGCIFKNPKQDLAAGYLIDKVGLKGAKIGGAMVSGKHANYIVNTGGATARDVKELIMVIKDEVKKVNGILMEEEIRII